MSVKFGKDAFISCRISFLREVISCMSLNDFKSSGLASSAYIATKNSSSLSKPIPFFYFFGPYILNVSFTDEEGSANCLALDC